MEAKAWLILKTMIATKTNCLETSSMGPLFDAVSSLLCLRNATNYEGQAAIELEQIADVIAGKDISLKFPVMGVSYAPRMLFARP